jgi:hypothetical protein
VWESNPRISLNGKHYGKYALLSHTTISKQPISTWSCFRYEEPDSREKLKARVVRVCRDLGPFVQYSSQAHGKYGRDAFAPLLARKIRERSIRHGILHRVSEERAETVSIHPGYVCRLGENGRRGSRISCLAIFNKQLPFPIRFLSITY